MRLVEVILLAVLLSLFCGIFSDCITSIRKLDVEINLARKKKDCICFISKSFCKTCEGKGFETFEEWKKTCRAMWLLEEIEYEAGESEKDKSLMVGKWNGAYGSGIVYCRRKNESQNQRYQ